MTTDQMTTARLDTPVAEVEEQTSAGALLWQRHWLYEADADSQFPAFVDLTKGIPAHAAGGSL